jgi:hypothetical protein
MSTKCHCDNWSSIFQLVKCRKLKGSLRPMSAMTNVRSTEGFNCITQYTVMQSFARQDVVMLSVVAPKNRQHKV